MNSTAPERDEDIVNDSNSNDNDVENADGEASTADSNLGAERIEVLQQ